MTSTKVREVDITTREVVHQSTFDLPQTDARVGAEMDQIAFTGEGSQEITLVEVLPGLVECVAGRITYNALRHLNARRASLGTDPSTLRAVLRHFTSRGEMLEHVLRVDGAHLDEVETALLVRDFWAAGYTQVRIAKLFGGKTQPWVAHQLKISTLPAEITQLVRAGVMKVTAAVVFSNLPAEMRSMLLDESRRTGRRITSTVLAERAVAA